MRVESLLLVLLVTASCTSAPREVRPNVLFISVDDMADWASCLSGHPDARTPNIDRIASRGILFRNAHCTSPICGPSRAAVLTGMRPETTGVYHNRGTYVDYVPRAVSLQRHFMAAGYQVLGTGKVNHGLGMVIRSDWTRFGPDCGVLGTPFIDDELDGTMMRPTRRIDRGTLQVTLPMNGGLSMIDRPLNKWDSFDWGPLDVPDTDFPDHRIASWACEQISKQTGQPLFLAVGFYKPHQPFFVPRKYFDLHPLASIRLPKVIANDLDDVTAPGRDLALRPWTSGTHATVTKHGKWREAVQAYLATISFVDAQVGRVLDALDASPHADNTWIVLWSDHGWSLGQKEHWGKHAPWKASTRVPLIIVPPKNRSGSWSRSGQSSAAMVNLLDLYPTLIDACGLVPRRELEGRSLLPLIDDPKTPWDQATVTTVGRGSHSIATEDWRYIHYFDGSEELYDLGEDPEEWTNLAQNTSLNAVKQRLRSHIPIDRHIVRFVRWGRWKCVFYKDDSVLLFDLHAPMGISEQDDVAKDNPEVIDAIRNHLTRSRSESRYVEMK